MIPQIDTLWASVVEAPKAYSIYADPWHESTHGLDMKAARRRAVNMFHKANVTPEQCIVEPQCWATLDYHSIDSQHVGGETTWTAEKSAIGHGLGLWFDSALAPDVHFSNRPGAPDLIYGRTFFPWPAPVSIAPGDIITVRFQANLVGEDYVWCWKTRILARGDCSATKASFDQSTFTFPALSPELLRKRANCFVPVLNEKGIIAKTSLMLMAQGQPLGEIARSLAAQFPERFPVWEDALAHIGDLSQTYSA